MIGILVGGLFAFLFGGMILILALGARQIEDDLSERAAAERRAAARAVPRLLVVMQPAGTGKVEETILWQLQEYLAAEQTLAGQFVSQPSVETLYRDAGGRRVGH